MLDYIPIINFYLVFRPRAGAYLWIGIDIYDWLLLSILGARNSDLHPSSHLEAENHRIIKVGRDFQGHRIQSLTQHHSGNYTTACVTHPVSFWILPGVGWWLHHSLEQPIPELNHSVSEEILPDVLPGAAWGHKSFRVCIHNGRFHRAVVCTHLQRTWPGCWHCHN